MTLDQAFWHMQFKDLLNLLILLATIAAIVWGPIRAVEIARKSDDLKEQRRRQFYVFHALMKTRVFTLNPEHVMALNLIQVEFYGCPRIEAAYREYIAILNGKFPMIGDPSLEQFLQKKEDKMYDLLHEIAAELSYKYDKRDLQRLAYGPMGWQDDENQLRTARSMLIDMLAGNRPVPVAEFNKAQPPRKKYPPPPSA